MPGGRESLPYSLPNATVMWEDPSILTPMNSLFHAVASGLIALTFVPGISAVPVTFQVEMGVQQEAGNFDPSSDTVEVRGSFDNWGAGAQLAPSASDPSVYQATVDISGADGTQVQFKFVMNQAGSLVWEDNGVGPGGAQNRSFALGQTAQTLPAVNFNNQASAPRVVPVTFQVNVEIQRAIGNFDPAVDSVEVRGSFDNWGVGMMLEVSSTNANVYKGTVDINGSPGAPFEHKFVINHDGAQVWEGNVGPGGGFGNRTFTLEETTQVLPVVHFDNISVDPGAGVSVTFRVDMSVQAALGLFDAAIGTMSVAGQFNNWNVTANPLTNTTTEPLVYSGTANIKAAAGSTVPFKFVANDGTWETGDNRTFALQGPDQALPILFFNNQTGIGTLSITRPSPTEVQVSWVTTATARLQTTTNVVAAWQDVPASEGVSSMTFPNNGTRQFFRLVSP